MRKYRRRRAPQFTEGYAGGRAELYLRMVNIRASNAWIAILARTNKQMGQPIANVYMLKRTGFKIKVRIVGLGLGIGVCVQLIHPILF